MTSSSFFHICQQNSSPQTFHVFGIDEIYRVEPYLYWALDNVEVEGFLISIFTPLFVNVIQESFSKRIILYSHRPFRLSRHSAGISVVYAQTLNTCHLQSWLFMKSPKQPSMFIKLSRPVCSFVKWLDAFILDVGDSTSVLSNTAINFVVKCPQKLNYFPSQDFLENKKMKLEIWKVETRKLTFWMENFLFTVKGNIRIKYSVVSKVCEDGKRF